MQRAISLNALGMLFVCVAIGSIARGANSLTATVQKVQIADGVYQFITSPDGYVPNGNSVVIVNDSDVLVFDTFTRPSTARAVVAEIRKITNKPVRYVVNSHWHPDHWSGNEVYAEEFPSVEIIATEQTRQFMLNIANAWPAMYTANLRADQANLDKEISTNRQEDGTALTPEQRRKDEDQFKLEHAFIDEALKVHRTYPTLTYGDSLTLYHGGREYRFINVVGDARGTTILYLPKEKILITGDVISYPVPYFTPPLSEHAVALRYLAKFDTDVIIPGHGPACHDKSYLNLELELFDSIIKQVNHAVQQGLVTVDDVAKAVDVEDLRVKFTHDDKDLNAKFGRYVQRMIENAYREARDGKKF
jgi:cyclase